MANMTERNGLALLLLVSCQPSLNAYIFSFLFFFFSLNLFCYVFVLFCFVLFFSFNFPSWYQFNFVSFSCWKFNFTHFSHNYDNYAMFRDVPECSFNNDDLPFMPMVVTVLHDSPKHSLTSIRQFVQSLIYFLFCLISQLFSMKITF